MKSRVKLEAIVYEIVFWTYALFLLSNSFYFFSEISYPFYGTAFIPYGDWDLLWKIDFGKLHLFDEPVYFLASLDIANLLFNLLTLFSSDCFFSFNLTPTLVLIICLFLVYRIGSFEKNKFYGLLACFIFSTLPVTGIYSKYNIYHLNETMYVLAGVYFYLKSNALRRKGYVFLYLVALVFMLFGEFGANRSRLIYVAMLLFLNAYFFLKSKKNNFTFLRQISYLLLIALLLSILFLVTADVKFLKYYVADKFSPWFLAEGNIFSLLFSRLLQLPLNLYRLYVYPVYFWLILSAGLLNFYLRKEKTNYATLINYFILIPLIIHVILPNTYLEDVFPVFALLSLKIMHIVFIAITRRNEIKNVFLAQVIKKIAQYKNLCLVMLILYGLSLSIPFKETSYLNRVYDFLRLKKALYLSHKQKMAAAELENIHAYLVNYIKVSLVKKSVQGKVLVLGAYVYDIMADLMVISLPIPLKLHGVEIIEPNIYLEPKLKSLVKVEVENIAGKYAEDLPDMDYFVFLVEEQNNSVFPKITTAFKQVAGINFTVKKSFNFILAKRLFTLYLAEIA